MPPVIVKVPETTKAELVDQVAAPPKLSVATVVAAQVLAALPARAKVEYVVAAQVWAAPL